MKETIFETTDVFNKKVVLYKDDYENHIVQGHIEMKDNAEAIKQTVEKPNVVYKSKKFKNREIFFKLGANTNYKGLYTKTVVEYNEDIGTIKTSFLTSDIQGVEEGGLIYAKYNC